MTSATTYTHSHNPNNHLSRRASISATAPYTIPNRNNHSQHSTPMGTPLSSSHSNMHIPQHQQNHPIPSHGHTSQIASSVQHPHPHQLSNGGHDESLSSSVPLLSRDFVVRRISEGESGRLKHELKCEACGKGYKHISSLAKHLWEHTPEWNVTKKFLISKHQQVQLLEAASILVSMNEVDKEESKPSNEVKFNPKYQEQSPQPILEEEEVNDQENYNIKLRTGSISQYPPSQNSLNIPNIPNTQNSYKQHSASPNPRSFHKLSHSFASPAARRDSIINHGGFLDTPLKKGGELNKDALQPTNTNAIEDESESPNSNTVHEEEDDGTVFGKMD